MKLETLDDGRRLQLRITDDSDWRFFDLIATEIIEKTQGEWVEKLDGPDQRYWDIRVGEAVATLHLEHYLGITFYATGESEDEIKAGNELVLAVKEILEHKKHSG